jgi:hypothetical protein
MTPRDQVIAAVTASGGPDKFAAKIGIQVGHIHAVMAGRMPPGKRTCKAAGVKS